MPRLPFCPFHPSRTYRHSPASAGAVSDLPRLAQGVRTGTLQAFYLSGKWVMLQEAKGGLATLKAVIRWFAILRISASAIVRNNIPLQQKAWDMRRISNTLYRSFRAGK